nr:hypothetical protein [Streptomyces sp. DSM 41633]
MGMGPDLGPEADSVRAPASPCDAGLTPDVAPASDPDPAPALAPDPDPASAPDPAPAPDPTPAPASP